MNNLIAIAGGFGGVVCGSIGGSYGALADPNF